MNRCMTMSVTAVWLLPASSGSDWGSCSSKFSPYGFGVDVEGVGDGGQRVAGLVLATGLFNISRAQLPSGRTARHTSTLQVCSDSSMVDPERRTELVKRFASLVSLYELSECALVQSALDCAGIGV
jgi:hypothetical protein